MSKYAEKEIKRIEECMVEGEEHLRIDSKRYSDMISLCGIASEKSGIVKHPPMAVLIKALNEAVDSGDYELWDESSHSNRLTLFDPEEKKSDECRHKKNPKVQIACLLSLPKCTPRNRGLLTKIFLLDRFSCRWYTACCMLHAACFQSVN